MEFNYTDYILGEKKKAALNKPFRLPKGSNKKFGVYVKNDKGNTVMVKFGDPNMEIKRDNPERRKSYRARHNCSNPGPKWKANYWSCKMWSAKPVSKVTKSSEYEETILEIELQAKNKGLWHNIREKKKRMGKNYKPARPGSPDRPKKDAWEKAQGEYEWDGETEFNQKDLLLIDPSLSSVEEIEESSEELKEYKQDFYGMIVGSISSIQHHAKNILDKIEDPVVKKNLAEPFLQQQAALAEDYIITIHNYVMFNKESEAKYKK